MKRAEVGLNGDVMPRLQSVMSLDSLLTNNLASGPFSAKASPLQLVVGLKRRSTCCYSRPILLLINNTSFIFGCGINDVPGLPYLKYLHPR